MTDGNLSTSTNGIALMGILDRRPGNTLQSLHHTSVKAPEYRPRLKLEVLEDRDSLQSVDSGIPTLEIGNPEPVPCSAVHAKRKQSESDIAPERAFQSACPLPSCAPPVPSGAEREPVVRKSSTFPRTGYDTLRLCSPTAKALSRSDDVSLCSVSSLGTELSTTLSVSNEDILDLLIASNSSAIVTLESDDNLQFTDVTLSSTEETGEVHLPSCAADSEEGREPKLLGPLSSFFTRNLLARKQNARLDKQNDLGWKLFGKVPLRENAHKDSKKMQKVSQTLTEVCCCVGAAPLCEACRRSSTVVLKSFACQVPETYFCVENVDEFNLFFPYSLSPAHWEVELTSLTLDIHNLTHLFSF